MTEREQWVFQLIRYVPDPVKNEFVNIGVLLHAADGKQRRVRFTQDWARVKCLDPDADTEMLAALEMAIGNRLEAPTTGHARSLLNLLEESLSNCLQITETKAYLADSLSTGLEDLMRLYIDNPRRERTRRRSGRATVYAAMRKHFEAAGVWRLMRQQIAAADYTRPGDPLRIDCGYRPNGVVKMFQAVSLESDAIDAKLLAYSAEDLRKGVVRVEKVKELELTAIIEPIGWPDGDNEPDEERSLRYEYAMETMKLHDVRVMTTSDLANIAETARRELRV